jgi:hypothetical protein
MQLKEELQPRMMARLYLYDALLQRLAQNLQDVTPELRQFIEEENAVVRQRPLAKPGEVSAADQPHSRDRLRRGATWAGCDHRRAGAGETSDTVDARGLEGFGQAHGR